MSNEKYYTPHISEFYVGFRYEKINSNGEWEKFDDFSNSYDYEDNPHYAVSKDIEHGRVRVKFLDREDIEAEGWYFNKSQTLPVYELFTPKGLYDLIKSHPDFYGQDKYTVTLHESGTKNSFTLFSGTIKNRSELRKVMEMIGITK